MSWSLPVNLKLKLSAAWIKFLEMLANSHFCHSAAGSDPPGRITNRNADHSDNVTESWEVVLSILEEEEAVEKDGELKILPVFLSLPLVLQLRLIFYMRSNVSRISSSSVQIFLKKIDSCQRNSWVEEALCQLRNSVAIFNAETNQLAKRMVTKYTFTSESQNTLHNILSKLRNGKFSTMHDVKKEVIIGKTSENTEDILVKSFSSASALTSATKSSTFSFPHLSEETTDIIIVDDESTDCETTLNNHSSTKNVNNAANECSCTFNTFATRKKLAVKKLDININYCNHADTSNDGNNIQNAWSGSINTKNKEIIKEQTTPASYKSIQGVTKNSSLVTNIHGFEVQNLKANRKRKFSDIFTEADDMIKYSVVEEDTLTSKIGAAEDLVLEVRSATPDKISVQSVVGADSVNELSENVLLYLDNIREACSSKENAFIISKDIMNCFLKMEIAQIKMACTYLGLIHFSENALVNFCDSMPWTNLANESSVVLLDSCFTFKLTNLQSQASRTLLMSLNSVSKIQSKALITVLAHILKVTHSGEFQCQVLTSVCKDFLPPEYFGYMLRQLNVECPVMNEHLVNVLQTLVDKGADFETDSLNHFHSLLTSGYQEVSSSARFGKLLMAALKKYLKKMSSQQFITICAVVESHNSSFRKPLQTLVKRCM